MEKLHEFQESYINELSSKERQFAHLPLGIGVDRMIEEVARRKGKRLIVIAPRLVILSRAYSEGVPAYTPQQVVHGLIEFTTDDLVFIEHGMTGRSHCEAVFRCLSTGVDFIWRVL